MPVYEYVCNNSKGERIEGTLEAADHKDLVLQLWEKGLFLVFWKDEHANTGTHAAVDPVIVATPTDASARKGMTFSEWIEQPRNQQLILWIIGIAVVLGTAVHCYYRFRPEPNPWRGVIPPSG